MTMREKHVLDPRSAGDVERYHTWVTVQRQTVGQHTWQVLRLLLQIWPDAPAHVLAAAVYHDMGEIWAGDVPYHAKKNADDYVWNLNGALLKRYHDEAEERALSQMAKTWHIKPWLKLDEPSRWALKIADLLDMWEFALRELEMGNRHGALVRDRCVEHLGQMLALTHMPEVAERTRWYMTLRTEWHREICSD